MILAETPEEPVVHLPIRELPIYPLDFVAVEVLESNGPGHAAVAVLPGSSRQDKTAC